MLPTSCSQMHLDAHEWIIWHKEVKFPWGQRLHTSQGFTDQPTLSCVVMQDPSSSITGTHQEQGSMLTVQQQPPPGTFNISSAFVIRGVWDTILQWDTSECHHYLEQTLEHSNQTFRYLIQTQNPWERERRGANFQADFQVKYLPNINEIFLVEFTAVSHGIINCMRFCTCGRWNWPLGSAAEREVVLCTLRATSECQNCSQLWQTDTKQLSSTFVQNLSLLQYINRKKKKSVSDILFSLSTI